MEDEVHCACGIKDGLAAARMDVAFRQAVDLFHDGSGLALRSAAMNSPSSRHAPVHRDLDAVDIFP
jgi:hypothetical protein